MRSKFSDTIRFLKGFILGKPKLDARSDYAADGSSNVLFLGQAKPRPFKGLALVSGVGATTALQVSDGVAGLGTKP